MSGGFAFPHECTQSGTSHDDRAGDDPGVHAVGDATSCVSTPYEASCTSMSCAQQGISCGPAGDGCGNLLQCGSCPSGETCGGGGDPGVCGGACKPTTCHAQGISCGPAGDGCGGALSCGSCPAGQTCGGGGTPGVCGGGTCTPRTCENQGITCGPAGDGCGNALDCGSCPTGQACGASGQPGTCGNACVPKTCGRPRVHLWPSRGWLRRRAPVRHLQRAVDLRRRRHRWRLREHDGEVAEPSPLRQPRAPVGRQVEEAVVVEEVVDRVADELAHVGEDLRARPRSGSSRRGTCPRSPRTRVEHLVLGEGDEALEEVAARTPAGNAGNAFGRHLVAGAHVRVGEARLPHDLPRELADERRQLDGEELRRAPRSGSSRAR